MADTKLETVTTYRVLYNTAVPASGQGIVALICETLEKRHLEVEREKLDEARLILHFKLGGIIWGGAKLIDWGNGTTEVTIWPKTLTWEEGYFIKHFPMFFAGKRGWSMHIQDTLHKWLEKLSDEILRKFTSSEGVKPANDLQESTKEVSALPGYAYEQRAKIDEACKAWAGRGYITGNMSDFLQDFDRKTGIFLSVDQFKDALKDAGGRGLIVKRSRRWRLPENSP